MFYCSVVLVLLQEAAIGNISFWVLIGWTSAILGIVATIGSFVKAFNTKANKKDLDDLVKVVGRKANQVDFIEMQKAVQQLQIRHEQANTEIMLEISKQIGNLDKKFDSKFDNLTNKIINIVSNGK